MAVVDNVGTLPHRSLLALVWACFSAAFLVVSLRTVVRLKVVGQRPTSDDCWIYLALTTLLTLCILETVQLPSLYYMTAAVAGAIPVSPDLITNTEEYLRFEFPIIILFWTVLWCVKGSFLALYYKLFRELRLYRRVWYVLSAFTFIAYVGCVTTLSLSCRPTSNFFKFAQCGKSSDIWASNFSVYYSTVIDVFTDVCSKLLRDLVWTLLTFRSHGDAVEVDLQRAGIIEAEGGFGLRLWIGIRHNCFCHHSSKAGPR